MKCQYDDSKALHYGNACVVGHTGTVCIIGFTICKIFNSCLISIFEIFLNISSNQVDQEKVYWGRDCVDSENLSVGCDKRIYENVTIEVCVCKEEGCNKEMKETTTNKAPTTTHKGTRAKRFIKRLANLISISFIIKHW